jgi:Transposase DDE domain group 1
LNFELPRVRRSYASFTYQAGSWLKPRRVIAKVEWHPGELYPRVGFIVTNMSRPTERVIASTTNAEHASNGSRKARTRLNGRGCHVGRGIDAPPCPLRRALEGMADK